MLIDDLIEELNIIKNEHGNVKCKIFKTMVVGNVIRTDIKQDIDCIEIEKKRSKKWIVIW